MFKASLFMFLGLFLCFTPSLTYSECLQGEQGGECVDYARAYFGGSRERMPGLCTFNSDCGAYNAWGNWDLGYGYGKLPKDRSIIVLDQNPLPVGHMGVVVSSENQGNGTYRLVVNESNWDGDQQIDCGVEYIFSANDMTATRGGASSYPVLGFIYGKCPGSVGDVNSDARVDLLEAVYALQTVSGLRPQPIDPKFENTVNFTLDSANIEASGNGLSLFNARLQSDNVSIEDSVDIEMEFSNGGFSVKSVVIHEEVGVYYDWLFAKDVTTEIAMEIDSQTYEMNRSYSFRTNQEDRFIFNLEKGQVLSWTISGPNVEYNYSFCSADENGNCLEELRNLSGEAYQSVISWPVEILTSGKYALKVWPLDNSGFVNFGLKFLNANRRQLVEVENGAKLSASLARNLRDYAKYKINGCNPII